LSSPKQISARISGWLAAAVWKSRTGSHLFVNLDPASIARLTQPCGSEEEFNSLMSALADVLGQVMTPGTAAPPQRGALEAVRDHLAGALDTDAAERTTAAVKTLIRLRHIRVSTQHSDARHKAVAGFAEIWPAVPPRQLAAGMDAHRGDGHQRPGRAAGRGSRGPSAVVTDHPGTGGGGPPSSDLPTAPSGRT